MLKKKRIMTLSLCGAVLASALVLSYTSVKNLAIIDSQPMCKSVMSGFILK